MDPDLAAILGGVSSVIGLVALAGYMYFITVSKAAKRSISDIIEGENLVTADQILKTLDGLQSEDARLKALAILTDHDRRRAESLMNKIRDGIDVGTLEAATSRSSRRLALTLGVVLLATAASALTYSVVAPPHGPVPKPSPSPPPQRISCFWRHGLQFVNNMNDARLRQRFPDIYAHPISGGDKVQRLAKYGYFYASEGGGGTSWPFDIGDWGVPRDGRIDSAIKIRPLNPDASEFTFTSWNTDARHLIVRAYSAKGGEITQISVEFTFSTINTCPPVPN